MKRGRKALPDNERGKVTSLRLTPERIAKFKQLGGSKWLSRILDDNIKMDKAR